MPGKKSTTTKSAVTRKAKKEGVQEVVQSAKPARYVEGIGRRKTAVARVRLFGGHGEFTVNGKDPKDYFALQRFEAAAVAPLTKLKLADKFKVSAKVRGGGIMAQAEAVQLGLARAIAIKNPDFQKRLKKLGFLTRDPRMVERKKYGLKKARRAPQWQKR